MGGGAAQATTGWNQEMSADIETASPAPLCRAYNYGTCSAKGDHTVRGYRHLHYCSHCSYSRVELVRHSENECDGRKQKDIKKKSQKANEKKDF